MCTKLEEFSKTVEQAEAIEVDGVFYGRTFCFHRGESVEAGGIRFEGKNLALNEKIREFSFDEYDLEEIQFNVDRQAWVVVKDGEIIIIRLYKTQLMKPLNAEERRVKEYLESGGQECPNCGSRAVDCTEGVEMDVASGLQKMQCEHCLATWKDTYNLVGIIDFEIPQK